MNRLKNWWNKWGLVDLLTLGGGIVAAYGYIAYFTTPEDRHSALLNLWPNIATEILGVWLSVRIIGAILDKRQERRNVRNTLAGNLNHLLGICQRLAPKFYDFYLIDLQNEITFYNDRKRLSSSLFKKHFSRREREAMDKALGHAQIILDHGRGVVKFIEEAAEVQFSENLLVEGSPTNRLREAFDSYRRSEAVDINDLENALNTFRSAIEQSPPLSESDANTIKSFRSALEAHLTARRAYSKTLSDLEQDVRAFREIVWAEFS